MSVLLGVDAGGSKTDVLVVDHTGRVLDRRRAGPANHEGVGHDGVRAVLTTVVGAALAATDTAAPDVAASAWGLAGLDWSGDVAPASQLVADLGFVEPCLVVNDAWVALCAGAPSGLGIVLNSGTGVVAAGRDALGRRQRTPGVGAGFGDWGSGPDIVTAALHSVVRAYSGLGPPTALTQRCLQRSGMDSVEAFAERVWRARISDLLPTDVWEVAAAGDAEALAIADRVAASLAAAATAVARRLGVDSTQGPPFDLVLSGRVLVERHPVLHDRLIAALHTKLPHARPVLLRVAPVVGAVLMAAEAAGLDGEPLRKALLPPQRP